MDHFLHGDLGLKCSKRRLLSRCTVRIIGLVVGIAHVGIGTASHCVQCNILILFSTGSCTVRHAIYLFIYSFIYNENRTLPITNNNSQAEAREQNELSQENGLGVEIINK